MMVQKTCDREMMITASSSSSLVTLDQANEENEEIIIPRFANARNKALEEAISEHAEQLIKRELVANKHANRAYLVKQHQKEVQKALKRIELCQEEYEILHREEIAALAKAKIEKVRLERERKKKELTIKDEHDQQKRLKARITNERGVLEELKLECSRQTRNASVWEKRKQVVDEFEKEAVARDLFVEKQERDGEKLLAELSKKLRKAMDKFETINVERLAEITSRKGGQRDLRETLTQRKELVDRLLEAENGLEKREREKRRAREEQSNAEQIMNESKRSMNEEIQPKRREFEKRRKFEENEYEKAKRVLAKAEDTREIEKNKLKETKRKREYQKRALKQASDSSKIAREKLALQKRALEDDLKFLEQQKMVHSQTIQKRDLSESEKKTVQERQVNLEQKRKEFEKIVKNARKLHTISERDATKAREDCNEKSRKLQTLKALKAGAYSQKQNAEELLKQNSDAEKRTSETILTHAFRVNALRRKLERKEGILPEVGVSSEQFEKLQKKIKRAEEALENAKKERASMKSADQKIQEIVQKARLNLRALELERERFEKDILSNTKIEALASERWSSSAEDTRDNSFLELHFIRANCGKEANILLKKDDACDLAYANEMNIRNSFQKELEEVENERRERVGLKKEVAKEKSLLVKMVNQMQQERDNAKSRYEKTLLVANIGGYDGCCAAVTVASAPATAMETTSFIIASGVDDMNNNNNNNKNNTGGERTIFKDDFEKRRDTMQLNAQKSISNACAKIKELNARICETENDIDRVSLAISDVDKSNVALMNRIRGKSLKKSAEALKREAKVKDAKERERNAEMRLIEASRAHDMLNNELIALEETLQKIQLHSLKSLQKANERAKESEQNKKERLIRAQNIEKKLLNSLHSLAKSSAKKAEAVFASEAKIKTMETRADVRDAVRVLRNAVLDQPASSSDRRHRLTLKTSTQSRDDQKRLAIRAVLNAVTPAREGTSMASSLRFSSFSDISSNNCPSLKLLQKV